MAGTSKDPMMEELKKTRRKLSARLWKAMQEGRFMEEMRKIDRDGRRAEREALKPSRNGRRRS